MEPAFLGIYKPTPFIGYLLTRYTTTEGNDNMPRKRQSTKSRIVKSAWNLFYKNGYDDTTVEKSLQHPKHQKALFIIILKAKKGF